jgi:hypothetical protein
MIATGRFRPKAVITIPTSYCRKLHSVHIVIDSIDRYSSALRGSTPTPSFKVRFSSQTFGGTARLVPASGIADAKIGTEFEVEIAQESVTGFRVSEMPATLGVEPLSTPGDFKVRGTVRHVSFPSEPVGNRITYVQAGDAEFFLTLQDIGDLRPEMETTVEFIVHDLLMWDEAI